MNKKLFTRLILPLTLLTVASLWVNTKWAADGFFVNLATEFIGIGFTVAYVDWILRKYEKDQWRGIDSRIGRQIQYLCNASVTGLRGALGFSADILDQSIMMSGSLAEMNTEQMRVATQVLAPAARDRLEALDQSGWLRLANHLQTTSVEADRLLDRFGHHLAPAQIELLLDIQQAIHSALTFYRTFPDFVGVPPEKLPASRTPPQLLQANGYDMTARELKVILHTVQKLSGLLNRFTDA